MWFARLCCNLAMIREVHSIATDSNNRLCNLKSSNASTKIVTILHLMSALFPRYSENVAKCLRNLRGPTDISRSCLVLPRESYWPTLLRSQTVRAGARGEIYSKCVKLILISLMVVAILSGSEFQLFIVLGKNESAGVDGIECFGVDRYVYDPCLNQFTLRMKHHYLVICWRYRQ